MRPVFTCSGPRPRYIENVLVVVLSRPTIFCQEFPMPRLSERALEEVAASMNRAADIAISLDADTTDAINLVVNLAAFLMQENQATEQPDEVVLRRAILAAYDDFDFLAEMVASRFPGLARELADAT